MTTEDLYPDGWRTFLLRAPVLVRVLLEVLASNEFVVSVIFLYMFSIMLHHPDKLMVKLYVSQCARVSIVPLPCRIVITAPCPSFSNKGTTMRALPYTVISRGGENVGTVVMTMSVSGLNHAFDALE